MSKTTVLVFNGGSVGGASSDRAIHHLFLRELTITELGQEVSVYALLDLDRPTLVAPNYEPVSAFTLFDWCSRGDVLQVDVAEALETGTNTYSAFFESANVATNNDGSYIQECVIRVDTKLSGTTPKINTRYIHLSQTLDESASVAYLCQPTTLNDHVVYGDSLRRTGKVHFLKAVYDSQADVSAPYGFWIVDLEKPNPNSPYGYDYAMAEEVIAQLSAGEVFVLSAYPTAPSAEEDLYIMGSSALQSHEGHTAVRIWFTQMFAANSPEYMYFTTIYTPSMYNNNPDNNYPEGRMAILNWRGQHDSRSEFRFMPYTELAAVATSGSYSDLSGTPSIPDAPVQSDWNEADTSSLAFIKNKPDLALKEDASNKVQIIDNNSEHYPSCPAVKEAIDTAVASAYHAAGTKTVVQLTSALLVADNQGNVYNITDSGTTTADFVDGAGHPIVAGDNVGVYDVGGGVYKFDLLSGFVDLSGYLAKTGDGSNVTSAFTKASGDTSSITSGGKLSAIFTAISNFFSTIASHIANTSNPHNVTKTQVGLNNVDNTSDLNKPVSTAMQAALNTKANDSSVVHLVGAETITGQKTFSGNLPILQTGSTPLKLTKKILFGDAGTNYNSWDSNLKDGNHYRRWRIKLGIDSTSLYYLVVNVYGVWNRTNSSGVLSAKYTVFSNYVNKSFYSNSKCYLAVDSIDTAQEFRLSPAIYDATDGYCIDIVSSKPASDNPISVVIDVASNVLKEITLSDATIIEGWPAWAGDIDVVPRLQSNEKNVMLAGDPVPWSNISGKPAAVNVNNTDHNTQTSSFTFVNGHIYHLTLYLEGSLLATPSTSSGTGYVEVYIGSSIGQSHYSCRQFVDIQSGELTTKNIRLPIDWKAENIAGSSDNQLHVAVIFNNTRYGFSSVSDYELTLIGTDFNGA